MEFSHVGDVLHPSPDDVEAAVRAAGTNTGEEVLEAARRKKMSFVRRQLAPEASRRVDAALSEGVHRRAGVAGRSSPSEAGLRRAVVVRVVGWQGSRCLWWF